MPREPGLIRSRVLRHRGLTFAERDPAFGEVVGREFDLHLVTWNDADEIFSHLACDVCVDDVTTGDLHAKPRVGEGLRDDPFNFESLFLIRHEYP